LIKKKRGSALGIANYFFQPYLKARIKKIKKERISYLKV